jgi:hypothetical protein
MGTDLFSALPRCSLPVFSILHPATPNLDRGPLALSFETPLFRVEGQAKKGKDLFLLASQSALKINLSPFLALLPFMGS